MEVYPGITMDPAIRFGKPCITGTRIDVSVFKLSIWITIDRQIDTTH